FIEYCAAQGKSSIKGFFTAFSLPERLVLSVFIRSDSAAAPTTRAADITAADRKKLLNAFCSLKIEIRSPEGRNSAMCTAGGVETSEINPATMESRKLPGLYFAGEIIDVDGDSGGFNLQYAFSSAAAAAAAITKL
ncbi:MAG TPA: NAD(P)/FAD-dependent oxidoreductase, partial [Spirochaeta sp.]|nr:NAD(P)/FAD-dependent oxidoreductase [Spirochaeta sp.]